MLSAPEDEARDLAEAIEEVKAKDPASVIFAATCANPAPARYAPTETRPFGDRVVEEPKDVMSIERTREYHGLYHVLGGAINPMANVGPCPTCVFPVCSNA